MSATVQIHVADTAVTFPSNSAKFALFKNTSAVSIDVTVSSVTETVATGGFLFITLTDSTDEVSCVRTDSTATAVDVVLYYGFDEETINLLKYIRTVSVTGGKIGFLGATPIVRRVGASGAAVTATSTDGTAAAASADLSALAAEAEKIGDDVRAAIVLVNELRATLVAFGLHKGAA